MKIIGYRALLFTDIEGSTALLQRVGPAYADLLDQHHRIMRGSIERGGGEEVQNEGDAFAVFFPTTERAVWAAVDAQRRLRSEPWPGDNAIRVRMGIHWGEIGRSESGYVGLPLHETARVANAAHGGQILISEPARRSLESGPPIEPDVEFQLLGEFALKDFGSNVPLIQITHPDLNEAFPAPRTSASSHNNLPAQLTTFIGREQEAIDVDELLGSHRLVTLSGAGGIGKTRLALNVAANAATRFADGVWLIELASLDSGAHITDLIWSSMRMDDEDLSEDSLLRAMRDKHALLVFDNCEHLLDEVAGVIERLLRACPGIRVLATSREPLGLMGEMRFRVASLVQSEAVRLFEARAALSTPGFEIAGDDLAIVERICNRLDGIPLAVELAAGRVGTMSMAQIESRLLDQFRLLTLGSRGGVARHQTLRATLDWSYRLLSPNEQVLLARLAVFRGHPTMNAVEAVCGIGAVDPFDVAELLHGLHAKSLLSIDTSHDPPRVQLTEIVRQYCAAALDDSGERALVAERHAQFFLEASIAARSRCLGPDRLEGIRHFADDGDDFATAFDWLLVHRPVDAAVLIGNTKEWLVASDSRSWLERLRRIAERTDVPPRAITIANALRAMFAGTYGREPAHVAATSAKRAYEHLDSIVEPSERLRVLSNLALGFREADPALAATLADNAFAHAQTLGDDTEMAWSLVDLMFVRHEHHPETRRLRGVLLELVDRLGSQWTNVDPLVDQALDFHQVGRYDDALASLDSAERMLASCDQRGEVLSEDAIVLALWGAFIRAEVGDSAVAILIAQDALLRLQDHIHPAKDMACTYGHALLLAGDVDSARAVFAIAIDRADGWRYLTYAIASIDLATIAIGDGDAQGAYDSLIRFATENRRLWVRARAHDVMAEAALALGDAVLAGRHADDAEELRRQNGFVVPPALRPRHELLRRNLAEVAG